MDGATEVAGVDLSSMDAWKLQRSERAQRMRQLSGARFASDRTQKALNELAPVASIEQLQGYVGFDIAQISSQIEDQAVFYEIVGFWAELLEARHGNYFIAGMEKLTPSRRELTHQALAGIENRANISFVRPRNTVIAWVDFVKDGAGSLTADSESGEIVIHAAGFDSDQLANIQAALAAAEKAAHIYAPRLQEGRVPQEGAIFEDIIKALQESSLPEMFRQFSEGRMRPDAKTLQEYFTGGLAAERAEALLLRPLESSGGWGRM